MCFWDLERFGYSREYLFICFKFTSFSVVRKFRRSFYLIYLLTHCINSKRTKCQIESAFIEIELIRTLARAIVGEQFAELGQHILPQTLGVR